MARGIIIIGSCRSGKVALITEAMLNHGVSIVDLGNGIEKTKEQFDGFIAEINKSNFESFEPEPSKFISKPKNNFKTR